MKVSGLFGQKTRCAVSPGQPMVRRRSLTSHEWGKSRRCPHRARLQW